MRSLFYQKNLLFYFLIILATFFAWHKTLNQVFMGEGYRYFNSKAMYFDFKNGLNLDYAFKFLNFNNFPKIFSQLIVPVFKDNIQIYQLSALVMTVILLFTLFKILSNITKDKYLSLTATIFLSADYFAFFEFLATGNYARFIERIPNLIPIIISFYFLWKFLETKRNKFLFVSLFLYCLGILMGQFSGLLLPIFIIYPFVQLLKEKINLKILSMRVVLCILFITATLILTMKGDLKPAYGFFQFFKIEQNIPERVLYQIPLITFPLESMEYIHKILPTSLPNNYSDTYRIFLIPSVILYLGGAILVYKKLPKLFILYLTFLLSVVSIMFLYMYVDPRLNVIIYFGEDRYFLPPLLFTTTLWAIIIKALFLKSKKKYIAASIIILTIFSFHNANKIWTHIDNIQYISNMLKNFTDYIRENPDKFQNGSIFIAPSYLSWPGSLIEEVILKDKNVKFVLESRLWDKDIWSQKDKVYVYDYDYKYGKGLIDLTSQYRAGTKIKFLY